jgi:hypothetical protein
MSDFRSDLRLYDMFLLNSDPEYQEKRRQYNKKYYEKTKYVRENKDIQTRLRKLGPIKRRSRLETIWASAAHEQALGEFFFGSVFYANTGNTAESSAETLRLPPILNDAVPMDLRDYLESRMHPMDELAMIRNGEISAGGLSYSECQTLYNLGRNVQVPTELHADFENYVAGPPYKKEVIDRDDMVSIPHTFKLRWLLAGFYQASMNLARDQPQRHFPIDVDGNVIITSTLQRRILEFVEYRKFERKCIAKGRRWHFMVMLDTHIEFTVLDILNLVDMLPKNTPIPPYFD